MPCVYGILSLLFVSEVTGQGFLHASNLSQGISREAKASNISRPRNGTAQADASSVVINHGSKTLPGDDRGDDDADSSDRDLRSNLQSEANFLKEELDEAGVDDEDPEDEDEDDSKVSTDQLQDKVNRLQDEVDRSKSDLSNLQSDGDKRDDEDDISTLQDGDEDIQDEFDPSKSQAREPDQSHSMTMTTITHGRQSGGYNNTALLQHLAYWNHLMDEAIASKVHSTEDPEVITVLLQGLKKHASIIRQRGKDRVAKKLHEDIMKSNDEFDETDDESSESSHESSDAADDIDLDDGSLEESDQYCRRQHG